MKKDNERQILKRNFQLLPEYSDYGDITGAITLRRLVKWINENVDILNEFIIDFKDKYDELIEIQQEYLRIETEWDQMKVDNTEFVLEVTKRLDMWIEDPRLKELINDELFKSKLDVQTFNDFKDVITPQIENLDGRVSVVENNKVDRTTFDDELKIVNKELLELGESKASKTELAKVAKRSIEIVSLKDFGAVGDGIHNDTVALKAAIESGNDFYIPKGVYLVDEFATPTGVKITGYDNPIIKMGGSEGKKLVMGVGNGTHLDGIVFESTVQSMEWNRCDITKKKNIVIENCSFKGFRHLHSAPNAWGIYIQESDNITIRNCFFDDNSQSDIAIVEKSTNISIYNCYGTKLHINFEPNKFTDKSSVMIENCNIDKLSLIETSWHKDTANITVINCSINKLSYYGASVKFTNCTIKNIQNVYGRVLVGGKIVNDLTLAYGNNLIVDNYLDFIGGDWSGYSATALNRVFTRDRTSLIINPNNESVYVSLTHKKIPVKQNTLYAFRIKGSRINDVQGGFTGWIGRVTLFNGESQVDKYEVAAFKNNQEHAEYVVFVNTETATHVELNINNGNGNTSTNGYAIEDTSFSEVFLDRTGDNSLVTRQKRILSKEPNNVFNKYYIGDIKIIGSVVQSYDGDKWI